MSDEVTVFTERQLWRFSALVFAEGALFGALLVVLCLRFPQVASALAAAAGAP